MFKRYHLWATEIAQWLMAFVAIPEVPDQCPALPNVNAVCACCWFWKLGSALGHQEHGGAKYDGSLL